MRCCNDKPIINEDTFVKKQIIILSLALLGTSAFSAESNQQELQREKERLTRTLNEIKNEQHAIDKMLQNKDLIDEIERLYSLAAFGDIQAKRTISKNG